jgi:peptidoglycan/xylan/chitin deacetylase (PgdA/CDA1 family)
VLDVLSEHDAPSTFFVLGREIAGREETLRRALAEGHALGNHSWNHPDLAREPTRFVDELRRCNEALAGIMGGRPRVFRPPLGAWTPSVLEQASEQGMTLVNWDVNPHDYAGGEPSAERIATTVLETARRGSIVVLHDGGPAREPTLEALPRIIAGLRDRGLRPVTVPELLGLA